MAAIAVLIDDIYVVDVPLEALAELPQGDLIDVDRVGVPDSVESVIHSNRFPVPPVAWGFAIDVVDQDGEYPMVLGGVEMNGYINGAVSPAGDYLEPTLGQIWPRIG